MERHSTMYSDGSGCFPLCESCWQELGTPEARMPYYRELWESWLDSTPLDSKHNGTPMPELWRQIESAVLKERAIQ